MPFVVSTNGLPVVKASFFLMDGNGMLGPAMASKTLKVERFFSAGAGRALELAISLFAFELDATGAGRDGAADEGIGSSELDEHAISPLEVSEIGMPWLEESLSPLGVASEFAVGALEGSISSNQGCKISSVSIRI